MTTDYLGDQMVSELSATYNVFNIKMLSYNGINIILLPQNYFKSPSTGVLDLLFFSYDSVFSYVDKVALRQTEAGNVYDDKLQFGINSYFARKRKDSVFKVRVQL